MSDPMTPTLDDVALHAGVSRATASRALSGAGGVRPTTREVVLAAADRLGYVPNQAARSLVTRRAGLVAVIVPESQERIFSDPFFPRVYHGAVTAFAGSGTQVVLSMSAPTGGPSLSQLVGSGHLDGALIVSHHDGNGDELRLVERTKVPVVYVGVPCVEVAHSVDLDNRAGARIATAHLISIGRRRLATVTGPLDMHSARQRLEGFRDALRDAALEPALVVSADFTMDGARDVFDRVRTLDIDGVFVASDLMACGVLQSLSRRGLRVPQDVALVGFDDSPAARTVSPALTTMTNPAVRMAHEAGHMLRGLMEGRPDVPARVTFTSELVRRQSA